MMLSQLATARFDLEAHIPKRKILGFLKNVKKRLSSCGMVWQTEFAKILSNYTNFFRVIDLTLIFR
jgi:hypothetical protein